MEAYEMYKMNILQHNGMFCVRFDVRRELEKYAEEHAAEIKWYTIRRVEMRG